MIFCDSIHFECPTFNTEIGLIKKHNTLYFYYPRHGDFNEIISINDIQGLDVRLKNI